MLEVTINDRQLKLEGGEIFIYIKYGSSKTYKWFLLKSYGNGKGYHQLCINK